MDRRKFMNHVGALSAVASLSQLGVIAARASTPTDYKALVCIFLAGGNDSNNMLVPLDTVGYANYSAVRTALALPQAQLLPLQENGGVLRYGLHPALTGLQGMWSSGKLAVVANVGTLVQPLTKAQYLSSATQKPATLFSHIDQQHEWQSAISNGDASSGWGGRLADQFNAVNAAAAPLAMISTGGNNLFVTGAASQALVIPTSGSFGLSGFGSSAADQARRSALVSLLGLDRSADLIAATQDVMSGALAASASISPILTATTSTVAPRFQGLTSGTAAQLLAIAKIIEARSTLGASRQVFLVSLGSFDTHTNELATQQSLFAQLDPALSAFHAAMGDIGAANMVTSFTLSDFSRTFIPNTGGGTDHAWGSHHLVAGGAVKGGAIYGSVPTLALGGPDDEGAQGRWIPTIAVDQYAATLSSWFGASASSLASVLPNLAAFSPANIGFV